MVQYQLIMGLQDSYHRRGGGFNKYLGNSESTLEGIWKNTFTKIEAYAGMTERMVIDLAISEALQNEIKETL